MERLPHCARRTSVNDRVFGDLLTTYLKSSGLMLCRFTLSVSNAARSVSRATRTKLVPNGHVSGASRTAHGIELPFVAFAQRVLQLFHFTAGLERKPAFPSRWLHARFETKQPTELSGRKRAGPVCFECQAFKCHTRYIRPLRFRSLCSVFWQFKRDQHVPFSHYLEAWLFHTFASEAVMRWFSQLTRLMPP